RVHLYQLEERSSPATCSRLPGGRTGREVGPGQRQADEGLRITRDPGAHPASSARGAAVKIRSVQINNRRKAFEVRTSARRLLIPFAKVAPKPTASNPVVRTYVDKEIGSEGFGYVLRSGREGTVHIEQVLEY